MADSGAQAAADWSPYPGLRPFQPDESEYFYGRDVQVDEVVARLRDKRFVAVIGGSGSGKSSLVLAGAIPRLRTFAIKDAGDFWAPVIATPGTNHVAGDGPVKRLARKFCAELVDTEDPLARQDECAAILRRENGLGELVERFGSQLKGCDNVSLDRLQVNYLFLLDQFEELFHPSNSREPIAADCKHLVDRIVEQFKRPHRQVCVAITMRSEHLNDCPRYEALPDAINAASYLVKRLDAAQLADAIEQPVLRYLRKHVAAERAARRRARLAGKELPPAAPAPDEIPIDDALVARLIADSKAVLAQQDHADHLPLLQHLLFWIWHEASERCEGDSLLDAITLDDLRQAVDAMPPQPLEASTNTLEACLKNRCEAIYASHVSEQELWEQAFRSLAFKEPNTGSYTQQRASMAELRLRLGIDGGGVGGGGDNSGSEEDALARHLAPWLAPHGYLHWDADSRTVKVAHETLIRRWPRLRQWIDEEDRQFHVYLRLLEDCERWQNADNPKWALSSGDTLRRYEDAQLPEALRDPARIARISRLLSMDRDGERLAALAGEAPRFLDQSLDNRREREAQKKRDDEQRAQAQRDIEVQRAKNAELAANNEAAEARNAALEARTAVLRERARQSRLKWVITLFTVGVVFPAVFAFYEAEKKLAQKERTLHRSYALAAESQVGFQPQFRSLDGPQSLLRYALVGADYFYKGTGLKDGPAQWPGLGAYFGERLDALRNTERFAEARNTASLRTILQGAVWALPPVSQPPGNAAAAPSGARPCASVVMETGRREPVAKTAVFFPRYGAQGRDGLVVARAAAEAAYPTAVKSISVGSIDAAGQCLIKQQLIATPQQQATRVGIAADAANLVIAFDQYTQFHTVMWDDPGGTHTRPRATVSSGVEFAEGALPTQASRFWADVVLGDRTVRLFDVEPSPVAAAQVASGAAMRLLAPGGGGSVCRAFAESHGVDLAVESVWELAAPAPKDKDAGRRAHCLRVASFNSGSGAVFHLASLYAIDPDANADDKGRDLPLVNQLALGESRPAEVRLDNRAGWLAFRDARGPWRAVPWSLATYREMGGEVLRAAPAAAAAAVASAASAAGQPRHCGSADDDPQFNLPYDLILGNLPCPSDADLKQGAVSPR